MVPTFPSVLLAPNEQVDFQSVRYPRYLSCKYDGLRAVLHRQAVLSRAAKPLPSRTLQDRLARSLERLAGLGLMLDGEVYDHGLDFGGHNSVIKAHDKPLTPGMKYYVFDAVPLDLVGSNLTETYRERLARVRDTVDRLGDPFIVVADTVKVHDAATAKDVYAGWLEAGFEGAISRAPDAPYKWGRATLKEGYIFKHKPYITLDGRIVEVLQRKQMKADYANAADRGLDELGRPKRTHKREHFEAVDAAGSLVVEYEHEGKQKRTGIGWARGFDLEARKQIWADREALKGRWVEFRLMDIGGYDEARHGALIRFRPDKDQA